MLCCNWYYATVGGSWEKGHYNTSSCMSNLLVLKHLLGVVLLQTFEQWGLEMCFKQQFVVWEFSFQCDAGFKFSGEKRVIVIIEAAVSFWTAAEPSLTSNVLMHLICRIQTPGELDVLMLWRSEGARCSPARPFLSPSQSLTSAGCFCWAGFPIVHTLSWLASQGCCWLL